MPRSPKQRAGLVVLGLVFGLLLFAVLGIFAFGFYAYVTADNIEFMDGKVEATASTACEHLDAGLQELPSVGPTATSEAKAERLDQEVALIHQLVAEVETLGHEALADDHPAEGWLRDWNSLAIARLAYAHDLRLGVVTAAMREPQTDDNYPVSLRMKDAAPDSCRVVDQLRVSL